MAPTSTASSRLANGAARAMMGGGRVLMRVLPHRVRQGLERRFFYALLQVTRVENDDYGRPIDPASAGSGLDEASRPLRRG